MLSSNMEYGGFVGLWHIAADVSEVKVKVIGSQSWRLSDFKETWHIGWIKGAEFIYDNSFGPRQTGANLWEVKVTATKD